ncbi:uncharacterized protein LOC131323810 [Rhododendron vialii]|uniref:uncharacterized protein LOC131323810 n=1 Tax=Rhododendron vialii TaxID=182163 RepID=UPI00265FB9E5|nr:uncharacterized protein LOC131323810 [Rhododendron vialii]
MEFDLWTIVEEGYTEPTITTEGITTEKPKSKWSTDEKNKYTLNSRAMNALFCGLSPEEYNKVSVCKTAKEIWDTLEVTNEGTSQKLPTVEIVRKILRALATKKWRSKVTAIEEAKNLKTLLVEQLIGSLITHEMAKKAKEKEENEQLVDELQDECFEGSGEKSILSENVKKNIAIAPQNIDKLQQITKQSRKFCSEAITFIHTLLMTAMYRKPGRIQDSQSHHFMEIKTPSPLLYIHTCVKKISPLDFFKLMDMPGDSHFFSSDNFRTKEHMPYALGDNIRYVFQLIEKKVQEHHMLHRLLQMQKQKPVPIKLLNPKFEETFVKGRDYDPNCARAEMKKLK